MTIFTLLYTVFKIFLPIIGVTSIGRIQIVQHFRCTLTRNVASRSIVISIVHKLFPHIVFQSTNCSTIEPSLRNTLNNDLCCVFSRISACLCKILFSYRLQIFRASSIISSYLCYRCIAIFLCFERYGPCMLTQHVGKNVVITFVEPCVRTHFYYISLPFQDFSSQTFFCHSVQKMLEISYANVVDQYFDID